ncbi:hypothetical protein EB836_04360 [Brevibacterium sp. S111]|nr:hypothetical protein EB836_04360 [Brevibacterium sp. S111]
MPRLDRTGGPSSHAGNGQELSFHGDRDDVFDHAVDAQLPILCVDRRRDESGVDAVEIIVRGASGRKRRVRLPSGSPARAHPADERPEPGTA